MWKRKWSQLEWVSQGNPLKSNSNQVIKRRDKRITKPHGTKGKKVMGIILIVILAIVLIGALPTWGHSKSWGTYPTRRNRIDHPDLDHSVAARANLRWL